MAALAPPPPPPPPFVPDSIQASAAPRNGQRPIGSLVASARRLSQPTKTSNRRLGSQQKSWQEDAWEMYDLVGEQRFLAATLAGRLAQAKLYVGKMNEDPTEPPEPIEDPKITAVLDAVGASQQSRAQLIQRLSINLFVAGDGWLAGIPKALLPASMQPLNSVNPEFDEGVNGPIERQPLLGEDSDLDITDLEWRMLSVSEVTSNSGGEVTLMLGENEDEQIKVNPEEVFLIRVWRPHPRRYWEADSPTRSSLPVLRELVGLTMHISAQVDSRLAGAGLLIVPQSAQRALNIAANVPEDADADQFTEALMEAMLTPIGDRASASALVPLVVTVPDEVTAMFNYMTFAKPLDAEARSLRDEAIRRLALGQDAPPELLLGTGGMNHWGAWLVREDVVTTHIEPPLALICDALTTQYLWPVLLDQGMAEETVHEYVVWYDVSHMVMRPNRAADATALHAAGVLSDETVRDANGFSEQDAPETSDLPEEITMALELVRASPSLAASPGIPALVAQIRAAISNDIPEYVAPDAVEEVPEVPEVDAVPSVDDVDDSPPSGDMPATSDAPAELPAAAAADPHPFQSAVLEAADLARYRAEVAP